MGFFKQQSTLRMLQGGLRPRIDYSMFFDRQRVINRLTTKELKILSGTGSFTRGAMRNSMRKARKAKDGRRLPYGGGSKPGEPPRRREGSLHRLIFFELAKAELNMVCGPKKLAGRSIVAVPKLLNEGGMARVVLPSGDMVIGRYLPRPFATTESPAGQAGIRKFRELTETVPL